MYNKIFKNSNIYVEPTVETEDFKRPKFGSIIHCLANPEVHITTYRKGCLFQICVPLFI